MYQFLLLFQFLASTVTRDLQASSGGSTLTTYWKTVTNEGPPLTGSQQSAGSSAEDNIRNYEIKLTSEYTPPVCALKNYNLNSREKFEPGQRFESRTSRPLA